MTALEHLAELRRRLLKSAAALVVSTVVCWGFIDRLIDFLTAPATNLYYMRPAEAFFIYLKIAVTAGFLLASPLIFYQLWAFVVPALNGSEKKKLLPFAVCSVLLFWSGILFAYYFVFPQGLSFFTNFAGARVAPMLSIESYLDFLLLLVVPFGFIFNLPMALLILAVLGLVGSAQLRQVRRYVFLAAFILAALITPTPDIVTQTLLAVPMLVLYEGSRLFIRYVLKK